MNKQERETLSEELNFIIEDTGEEETSEPIISDEPEKGEEAIKETDEEESSEIFSEIEEEKLEEEGSFLAWISGGLASIADVLSIRQIIALILVLIILFLSYLLFRKKKREE